MRKMHNGQSRGRSQKAKKNENRGNLYTFLKYRGYAICIIDLWEGTPGYFLIFLYLKMSHPSIVKILHQWCTTSGPRATSGPRRVVKWPARPNRKSTISDTALTLRPTHLGLISQHLNDFKLKVQGENQLGYHLANYCSAFKANRCCLHFIHFILST